jgi:CRP-like cAMP-binding protein
MSPQDLKPELVFLAECELFTGISEMVLQVIFLRGYVRKCEPGDTLFEIGGGADALYIVKSGVVEICRPAHEGTQELLPVAYLSAGDVLGEVAMFTQAIRSSAARLPEGGEVFMVDRENFLGIVSAFPELAMKLCYVFAKRLEATVKNMRKERQRQLSGNLKFFDLPTVIQTIIGSRMTGTLRVFDTFGDPFSEIFFDGGHLCSASLGQLGGAQAFYQLFQPPPTDGTFEFKGGERVMGTDGTVCDILLPGMTMLMEAVRMQDELRDLQERISRDAVYRPLQEELQWEGEEDFLVAANDVWYRLHTQVSSVGELLEQVPASHYVVYYVLSVLNSTVQIAAHQGE